MEFKNSIILIKLLIVQCLLVCCLARGFDFFYFVQQWPGSYCDTQQSCCYPTTGKPNSDFGIHGLWPNNDDGSYPSNCDPNNPFDQSEVSDLISSLQTSWPTLACPSGNGVSFWSHEWDKHGTCSESMFDQHGYFQTGINPDGGSYSLSSIQGAINDSIGSLPWIECNADASGNSLLFQVYICVDTSGSNIIQCPIMPNSGKCGSSTVEFPTF
ncbi:hypothetical protein RHMOL_Rhmol07G0303300 [Rhododendron molle]|uniref:Uncharacterized protein n=1 Tax=Rhododendron molle TaxID=49168 RepID=A0ACC0N741_RHOML|nr:hypothetical protein RHMOL_Rhmol07G0303300 [Rhododendron molle]